MSEAERSAKPLEEATAQVYETLGDADKRLRTFVAEQPVLALLGAAGLGFILARLLCRR